MKSIMKITNVNLYVTGSNSKTLSSEIITEFKDKGTKFVLILCLLKNFMIRLKALRLMWKEYFTYSGMPLVVSKKSNEEKVNIICRN